MLSVEDRAYTARDTVGSGPGQRAARGTMSLARMSLDTDTETIGAINPIFLGPPRNSPSCCQIGLKIPFWNGADGYVRPGTCTRQAEHPAPYGGWYHKFARWSLRRSRGSLSASSVGSSSVLAAQAMTCVQVLVSESTPRSSP